MLQRKVSGVVQVLRPSVFLECYCYVELQKNISIMPPQNLSSKSVRVEKHSKVKGLAAEAYTTVRERIIRGELPIGQVISRRKLAAELGMSFLPITEALIRLENEGLLESRPRAGTRVKVPTRQDIEGHYVMREALETQAAILFAERAERDERAELLKLARRVDVLGVQASGDRVVYSGLHEKLHRLIAEFARCPALCDAINIMYAAASTWLCATRPLPQTGSPTEHQDLLKVLVGEDPIAAGNAMRKHIRFTMECALHRMEIFFRVQKEGHREYPRTGKRAISLDLLVADSDLPQTSLSSDQSESVPTNF
ncbi:MAG TPA: GntR family transcriptional regulator [Bryobacteraceae bacterium]|nr:GntR family transcriptional regulator [Bryobacteraceae bacterium]